MDDFSNQGEQAKQKSQNITSSSDQREKWKLRQKENPVSFKPNFVTSSNNQPDSSKLNDVSTHLSDSSTPNAVKKEPRCRVNTLKQPANSDDPIGKGVSTKFDITRENYSNDGKPSDNSNVTLMIRTKDTNKSDTESKSIKMRKQIIYNDFSEQEEGHNSHVQHADELTACTESPDQYSKNTETVYLKQHSPGQYGHSVNKLHSLLPKQYNTHGRVKENASSRQSMAGSAEPVTCSHHLHGICQCCNGPFPEVKCINCGSFHIHPVRCCRCQEILFQCGDCMQIITSGENASSSHKRKPVRKNKNSHVKESSKDNENSKGTTNPINKISPSAVYYETANNMSEMVAKEGLIVKDVHPDGNCLFTAVVDQLRVRGEFFYTAKTLRAAAVSYLREHPSQHDGTPLSHFLTGSDTTWEGYLERMSHSGEWGDHIIISAIASILSRRLVILNGRSTLHRNIVEPIQSHARQPSFSGSSEHPDSSAVPQDQSRESISSDSTQGVQSEVSSKGNNPSAETSVSGDDGEVENVNRSGIPRYDDLYLGHIAEAHYFSLRHHDWETRLYECLKTKTTSCFLQYGLETETKIRTGWFPSQDTDVPHLFLMFTLKSIQVNKCILTPARSTDFRNKDVNCYNSSDDDLNAFVRHIEEKCAWTQDVQIIGQASSKTAPDISLEFYMEPQDSKVHTVEIAKERAQDKDLFCDSDGCHSGFTRLVPVSPMIWLGAVSNDSDKPYLKHILYPPDSFKSKTFLVFRCQFPSEAHEWLLRPRERNWPSDVTIGKIVMDGCKVIPLSHAASSTPDLEWAFSFERAEVMLASEAVTNEQKECFYFAKVIIDHIFRSSKIGYSHLKQVFFYMCEELENILWEKKPLVCVYLIIERFLSCCRSRFLPNYFLVKNNMVDHLGEDDFSDAIQKLEILQKHMFLLFYLTLDAHNQILDNNARMVDTVVENMQRYCVHRSVERSMEDCFIPLAVEGLASYVKESLYKEFLKQAMPVWKGLTDLANLHKLSSTLTMEELLFKVVKILPTKYFQWICAFLLDQVLGTYFLETVCRNCETISIFHFFGQSLASKLNLSSGDIVIPTVLTDLQLLPDLAVAFTTILKENLNIDGIEYKNCLAYFIDHYSAHIFDSLENPNTTEMTRTMCLTQMKIVSKCLIIEETECRISRIHEMKVSVNSILDQAEECFRSGRREEGAILAEKAMTLLKSLNEMEQRNH